MPAAFVGDNSYLDGMLAPVLRPKGEAPAGEAPAAAKDAKAETDGGKGKKEKKEKAPKAAPAAGDVDPKLEAFGKAQLQIGLVRVPPPTGRRGPCEGVWHCGSMGLHMICQREREREWSWWTHTGGGNALASF
jgi:hypothetical protein